MYFWYLLKKHLISLIIRAKLMRNMITFYVAFKERLVTSARSFYYLYLPFFFPSWFLDEVYFWMKKYAGLKGFFIYDSWIDRYLFHRYSISTSKLQEENVGLLFSSFIYKQLRIRKIRTKCSGSLRLKRHTNTEISFREDYLRFFTFFLCSFEL